MSGIRVKETMEQIHMPEEMREQVIRNIQDTIVKGHTMEKGHSIERKHTMEKGHSMKEKPFAEETHSMEKAHFMGETHSKEERNVEADSFSREYSDSEKERMRELLLSYADGIFPEKTLRLVEQGEELPEGVLYYVIETGYFNLPEREMTDQELLQIIDFNKVRNYALSQTPAGQEARGEYLAEQEQLRELVAAQGGISQEEAMEIAAAQMESQLGAPAAGMKYSYVYLKDLSKEDPSQKTAVVYVVVLRSAGGGSPYVCKIVAADGSILGSGEIGRAHV